MHVRTKRISWDVKAEGYLPACLYIGNAIRPEAKSGRKGRANSEQRAARQARDEAKGKRDDEGWLAGPRGRGVMPLPKQKRWIENCVRTTINITTTTLHMRTFLHTYVPTTTIAPTANNKQQADSKKRGAREQWRS